MLIVRHLKILRTEIDDVHDVKTGQSDDITWTLKWQTYAQSIDQTSFQRLDLLLSRIDRKKQITKNLLYLDTEPKGDGEGNDECRISSEEDGGADQLLVPSHDPVLTRT